MSTREAPTEVSNRPNARMARRTASRAADAGQVPTDLGYETSAWSPRESAIGQHAPLSRHEPLSRSERLLVVLLWMDGLAQFLAVFTVLMPEAWMDAVHRWWGLGALPAEPIVGYLARSLSALYAVRGAVTIFLASDIRRYWPLVRFWFVTVVSLGGALLAIDLASGMPLVWTLSEGPLVMGLGLVVLYLQHRCDRQAATSRA